MRRVILKTTQSPGDVVMLTAAVRELKRALGAGVGTSTFPRRGPVARQGA